VFAVLCAAAAFIRACVASPWAIEAFVNASRAQLWAVWAIRQALFAVDSAVFAVVMAVLIPVEEEFARLKTSFNARAVGAFVVEVLVVESSS
jgi:hypothetical protein